MLLGVSSGSEERSPTGHVGTRAAESVVQCSGLRSGSVLAAKDGIVTRGVLRHPRVPRTALVGA